MIAPVSCLVPTRRHVCVPGDAVLLLRGRNAVVTLGDGLYSMPINLPQLSLPPAAHSTELENSHIESDTASVNNSTKHERGVLVLSQYCAPLQVERSTVRAGVPKYFLECPASKRYIHPRLHDPVIAIVVKSLGAQHVQCYVNATAMAVMSCFAFDGASKSSRPRLKEGDVLYAYISALPTFTSVTDVPEIIDYVIDTKEDDNNKDRHEETKETSNTPLTINTTTVSSSTCHLQQESSKSNKMEMQSRLQSKACFVKTNICNVRCANELELSCEAAVLGFAAKDWSSKEVIFGQLQEGQLLSIPLNYAESLLAPIPAHLLTRLHNKQYSTKGKSGHNKRQRNDSNDKNDFKVNDANLANDTSVHQTGANVNTLTTHSEEEAPASYLIALLGQLVSFDFCVGRNGYCWVKANVSVVPSMSTASGVTLSKNNGSVSNNNGNSYSEHNNNSSYGTSQTPDHNSKSAVNNEMKVNIALSACINEARYDVTVDEMEMRVESYFAL